jgi:putative protein-disulfide isomerase
MCSWCWGFRPVWQQLQQALPTDIEVRSVLGGLAPDSDEAMSQEMQTMLQGIWRRIESQLGTAFNHDFWRNCQPRRSTYMACRAVLAAEAQGRSESMIEAIQKAYYLRAMNPSDIAVLVLLADELQLDISQFERDLQSGATELELHKQIRQAREWPISGFPSLVLEGVSAQHNERCPLTVDYQDYRSILRQIDKLMG